MVGRRKPGHVGHTELRPGGPVQTLGFRDGLGGDVESVHVRRPAAHEDGGPVAAPAGRVHDGQPGAEFHRPIVPRIVLMPDPRGYPGAFGKALDGDGQLRLRLIEGATRWSWSAIPVRG